VQADYVIETSGLTKIFKSRLRVIEPRKQLFRRKEVRTVTAINNLSLKIKRGTLFGLLGPNGAGKTTLVKMLCTLLPPDSGTAVVNGFDVASQQMSVKKSLGTLFSVGERGFFWRLNGYRNLEFFSAIYNVPRRRRHDRIMEVLGQVDLKDNAFTLYQKYSGGMKRRLALARALLPDPPILLLDEPTTGLDTVSSRNIRALVRNTLVDNSGKTVLYTTHNIDEASRICDEVGILNDGELIACDTPEVVRGMIKKNEAVELMVEDVTNVQIKLITSLRGVTSITVCEDELLGQKRLSLELESIDVIPVILNLLFKEKIKLINFSHKEPTLEDAFVELTGKDKRE
jgi:ABC-2 type transport system ATP-binding protein